MEGPAVEAGDAERMVIVPVRAPSPLPTRAVTVDSAAVDVSVVRATPFSSVIAEGDESEPALALKTTGMPASIHGSRSRRLVYRATYPSRPRDAAYAVLNGQLPWPS